MTRNTGRTVTALTIAALLLPGCATRPENVAASHVSSSRYADRTCKSLARELDEVQDALRAQSAKLDDKATQDAVVTGVGVILFWPVLFALGNNAGLEGDVARLKGEEQAIRRRMRDADCELPPVNSAPDGGTAAAAPAMSAARPPEGARLPAGGAQASAPAGSVQAVSDTSAGGSALLPVPARRGEGGSQ